ncbi:mgtC family protein [Methyloversatilis sp. RAC08]|uniref:MgtC/SapB family protein n=1 Tax=Methyloversatilis sp. RAC08 TaxID=1842540 RepID=UPI00083D5BAD|nr:MgtC/SapB family protein [Methyloversatilis sp. RAC08]AOF83783.1 mgtC family protein [Methyloversatilis sp. RAC08]
MSESVDPRLIGLAAALGIGLLIGMERERRKGEGPARAAAGLRTFTLAALLGALAMLLGGGLTLAVLAAAVGLLAVVSYRKSSVTDPGLTTEVALLLTFTLGALAQVDAPLATGIGVLVAIMLAARSHLHRFVVRVMSEQELHDALLLAAAALVILPLTPDRTVDPYDAINPRTLWTLAVLMMAINACGHIALRAAGPALGLTFAGFASGFVSSTATIAAMGAQAVRTPALRAGAVSGAVLSSLATVLQLALLLAVTSIAVLREMALPLLAAGVAALAYGLLVAWRSVHAMAGASVPPGRAFNPRMAVLFAVTMGGMLLLTSLLREAFGSAGLNAAVALAGFADAHSSAAAVAALHASGKIDAVHAVLPILIAFTTNAVSKIIVAATAGDRAFAGQVAPGVLLSVGAAWAVWLIRAG